MYLYNIRLKHFKITIETFYLSQVIFIGVMTFIFKKIFDFLLISLIKIILKS